MNLNYLESIKKQFVYYRKTGRKAIEQVEEEKINWQLNDESNSIAAITKHLWGNMMSRWTNFLTTDGEKEWRQRDAEFENDITTKEELLKKWNEGWDCLFAAIEPLAEEDLEKIIYIRNEGHTVIEAINRQLAHYAYHVGQLVFVAKQIKGSAWETLSIAKNASQEFNKQKFSQEKRRKHFTDE